MPNIETLEEARAEILRLQEENTALTNERDTLQGNNTQLSEDLERVRKLNQQYFNKLSAQYVPEHSGKDEPETPRTCEEFARSLFK